MEEMRKEKQAVPEPIDIITLLHDVLRGVKKLWWACLLLTVLCAAGSWYTAKRAYRPLYRAAGKAAGSATGFITTPPRLRSSRARSRTYSKASS